MRVRVWNADNLGDGRFRKTVLETECDLSEWGSDLDAADRAECHAKAMVDIAAFGYHVQNEGAGGAWWIEPVEPMFQPKPGENTIRVLAPPLTHNIEGLPIHYKTDEQWPCPICEHVKQVLDKPSDPV